MRGKKVEIVWMPFELRPYPTPTLLPEGPYLQAEWERSVYPLAKLMRVEIRLPAVSPQPYTRLAFEGLEFAKEHGAGDDYHSGVMRAFFQRGEDIGKAEALTRVASDAGLNAEAFRKALDEGTYAGKTGELLRYASERVPVDGVPLFLIGDMRLSGVQSRRMLEAAIERAAGVADSRRARIEG